MLGHGHEMASELVYKAVCWCNRRCKTNPIDLKKYGGKIWPNIIRKPESRLLRIIPGSS